MGAQRREGRPLALGRSRTRGAATWLGNRGKRTGQLDAIRLFGQEGFGVLGQRREDVLAVGNRALDRDVPTILASRRRLRPQYAPDVFNLRRVVSKAIDDPVVLDSRAYARLYASPARLAVFEENAGRSNTSIDDAKRAPRNGDALDAMTLGQLQSPAGR